jgi:hypothetical protein
LSKFRIQIPRGEDDRLLPLPIRVSNGLVAAINTLSLSLSLSFLIKSLKRAFLPLHKNLGSVLSILVDKEKKMIEEEEEQDQLSMSVDHQEYIVEDASSETDESSDPRPDSAADQFKNFTRNGMIKIGEESSQYESVKRRFLAGMKQYARDTDVVALHKISGSTLAVQARFAAFRVYEGAVLKKSEGKWQGEGEGEGEGVANIMYGWYGGSKEEITQIICHGFSRCNGQSHGVGVYLSPTNFLLDGYVSFLYKLV